MEPSADTIRQITAQLLSWYDAAKRDLPWRKTRDPYLIWVSEVMLQQTQAGTVIPYFERFRTLFPTIRHLAEAPADQVLKAWENLGYYSRARNLHQAAMKIVAEYCGRFPEDTEQIRTLPGVGDYIAGAVGSIAFGHRVPAVDGNVRRVFSRLFRIQTPVNKSGTMKAIYSLAAALVPENRPGDFNQALMDLGATVCTPRHPSCLVCPVRENCLAFQDGLQNELPVKTKAKTTPHYDHTAAIIADAKDRLLLVRRPEAGLLGGLWKWPGGRCEPHESPEAGMVRTVYEETGLTVVPGKHIATVKHQYSHFRITLHAFEAQEMTDHARTPAGTEIRRVSREVLNELALSKADRLVLDRLLKQGSAAPRRSRNVTHRHNG